MRPIDDVITQELTWTRAGALQRTYELRAGAEVVATVRCAQWWGAHAVVEAGDSHWTFRRVGFWHPRVTVRGVGSETDLATFHARGMGRGMLDLSPTRRFQRVATIFSPTSPIQWTWQQTDGTPLVLIRPYGLMKIRGKVEITPAAAALPELDLLVTLGWYLLPFGWYRLAMLLRGVIEGVQAVDIPPPP
jgi:hypothetical protein